MRKLNSQNNKKGAALLIVLIVIMTVTMLGMAFISKTDVELSCGSNMLLRTEMDSLAETALEQAKGLILTPWDITVGANGYWTGGSDLQLETGNQYYNITVSKPSSGYTPKCEYIVDVLAFSKNGSETVGQSGLQGILRLDPCVAFYSGGSTAMGNGTTVYGDVYCGGNFVNYGKVYGDTTAYGSVLKASGSYIQGQSNQNMLDSYIPVEYPTIDYQEFQVSYVYEDSMTYPVGIIPPADYSNVIFDSSAGNPAGIYYCNGNINLRGNVTINGTLIVNGTVNFYNTGNSITAARNYPAMLINGSGQVNSATTVNINGLVIIRDSLIIPNASISANLTIVGGLYLQYGALSKVSTSNGSISITASPEKAAIRLWLPSLAGQEYRWFPASGAYYKAIARQ